MNRRRFSTLAAAAAALSVSQSIVGQQSSQPSASTDAEIDKAMQAQMGPGPKLQIAMLVYPQFTALDLIGPHTFLAGLMNADVHLVWKNKEPVALDRGGTEVKLVHPAR